jgi:hypothetical protein
MGCNGDQHLQNTGWANADSHHLYSNSCNIKGSKIRRNNQPAADSQPMKTPIYVFIQHYV